ncbi:hypothetical protein NRIC_35760 [Enterococcus florum]|uniref:Alternate signal-mediated exported protein n=1 Tax=Enterococcus florum TaxID=2480627 RepID=A0A4P5PBV1_9ENTE|nr:BsaA family SipW-dependent biofilm matrix protein [Enterococcus florum]GCF95685.1 hypothetical protein NRIC_35760 [Enterococcus florum]
MNKKQKLIYLFKSIHRSKPTVALFTVFLSVLLVVGSTYSWITSQDERVNRAKSNDRKLSARIDEDFQRETSWIPGKEVEKKLRVENNGETPALVRLSLYEFLLTFENDLEDQVGNGGLKWTATPSATQVKTEDYTTWAVGNTYGSGTKHLKVASAIVNDLTDPSDAIEYQGTRTAPLDLLKIEFNGTKVFKGTLPPAGTKNYWFYQDGYFYYSDVLQPNDKTVELINSVTLDKLTPNAYKGSLYHLVPIMDAHDVTKSLLSDWQVTGTKVADMYQDKLH